MGFLCQKFKMAAEMKRACSSLLSVLRIITSNPTEDLHSKSPKSFEQVLINKIKTFENMLLTEKSLEIVRSDFEQHKREIFEFSDYFFTDRLGFSSTRETSSGKDVEENEKWTIRWTFVEVCLYLLTKLKDVLQKLSQICQDKNETKQNQNPKLNADALGVNDQKTLLTCVQFVISLGIYPNLLPGVGIPVEKRSGFYELIKGTDEEIENEAHLMKCLSVLLNCVKHPSVGAVVLSRYLGDILTGLIQVCCAPRSCYHHGNSVSNEETNQSKPDSQLPKIDKNIKDFDGNIEKDNVTEKEFELEEKCKNPKVTAYERENFTVELQKLLDRVYQPLIIKELLTIQGNARRKSGKQAEGKNLKGTEGVSASNVASPKWFTDVCGRLLSERVMRPNGVQAVLTAVLESSGASSSSPDWRKCDMVAMVIASCPLQANSMDEYYQHISPQVMRLLHAKHEQLAKQFVRVASSTVRAMLKRNTNLAKTYFLNVLMAPLLRVTESSEDQPGEVICDEDSLTKCIEDIHKVYVVGSDPQSSFLLSLHTVIHPIFELFCFTRKGVSHLRSFCQEILVSYLKHIDSGLALKTLYVLAYGEHPPDKLLDHPHGEPSEAVIKGEASDSSTKQHESASSSNNNQRINENTTKPSTPIKSEHSQHYGNHLPTLMRQEYSYCYGDSGGIVVKLCHDATPSFDDVMQRLTGGDDVMMHEVRASCLVELLVGIKNDVLAGEFFLHLMSKLTGIVGNGDETSVTEEIADLQVYDRQADVNQKSLVTLQLVAVMCDKLGPSILQNGCHMLAFIKSTLQRGCISSDSEPLEEALASETLTMAFGMLSAILGGATKVEAKERKLLEELMPLLEILSLRHNDPKVKEMANDLRIAIATHGAVWSEQMKRAAENLGKREDGKSDKPSKPTPDDVTFDETFRELCDPLVPVRGHAIITLAKLLHKRNNRALSQTDTLLKIFLDQLSHDDSYIYLAAVQGLAALSSIKTDVVLPHLAREFATCRRGAGKETNDSTASQRSPDTKIKLGEVLVKAVRECGELVPRYSQLLLSSLLSGVHDTDELVRASSLSNIGEVCKLLRFSIGPIINEIFNCLSSVLNTDKSDHVRRAAVLVATLLLRGLGKDAIEALGSSLRDLYHMIKLVEACDKDEITREHAQQALCELDTIMKDFLFPKQTFSKKIQVLP